MITLHMSMISRTNLRACTYHKREVEAALNQLGWTYSGRLIFLLEKSFPTEQEAIEGRRALTDRLRIVHRYCDAHLDEVIRT